MIPKHAQPFSFEICSSSVLGISLVLVTAFLVAGVLLFSMSLPVKWTVFIHVGLFALFIWIGLGCKKHFLFVFLIIALPFNADYGFFAIKRPHVGGLPYTTISVVDILTVALWIMLILEALPERSLGLSRVKPIVLPCIALVLAAVLSLQNAVSLIFSGFELFRLGKVLLTCALVLLYIDSPNKVRLACMCLVVAGAIEAGFALIQHVAGTTFSLTVLGTDKEILESHFGTTQAMRPGGTFIHANALGMFLNLCFPVALASAICARRVSRRILFVSTSLIIFVAILDTLSRAAWLSLFVGALVFFVFAYRRLKNYRRLCVAAAGALLISLVVFQLFTGHISQRLLGDDYGAARRRPESMLVAWNIIKENPWTGVGINNYSEVMLSYRTPSVSFTEGETMDNFIVHNLYLLFVAETGLVGALALVLFLIWASRELYWGLRSQQGDMRVYLASIGAGLISFGVHSLFDIGYTTGDALIYCFWFVIALLTGASHIHATSKGEAT